jgi:pimeloyl-ACP methyl ester carboxylesterase
MADSVDPTVLLSKASHIWDEVTNAIIRPPRADYALASLGPQVFRVSDYDTEVFCRSDFQLENMRGMKLECSHYQPAEMPNPMPCVVYLHGNSGSRVDGQEILYLLRHGFTLFTYDASGSGRSEGSYVTLGYYERQDLAAVCEYLWGSGQCLSIGLWGRSMGAVTAIMYASVDPSVACLVADSPFSSLGALTEDLVEKHAPWIPNVVANSAVRKVRKKVLKAAGFDFRDLITTKFASKCDVPAFIFHGNNDNFVAPKHGEAVAQSYRGSCLFRTIEGSHNSERGDDVKSIAVPFLRLYMIEKVVAQRPKAPPASSEAHHPKSEPEEADSMDSLSEESDSEPCDPEANSNLSK